MVEFLIVCYGDNLGYHRGAKLQILQAYKKWFEPRKAKICVVTDKPQLFENYPCRTLELTDSKQHDWSLGGIQHFGNKIKSLEWCMSTTKSEKVLLLDTDMNWKKDPFLLAKQITPSNILMYRSEGLVIGSKNTSIRRFHEGLMGREIEQSSGNIYRLSETSEMWASNVLGLHKSNLNLISIVYELFSKIEPLVDAHTVEQFSFSEVARMHGLERINSKRYTNSWSSIGKKTYVHTQLNSFFEAHGETNFEVHLKKWQDISTRRSVKVFINQKIHRIQRKMGSTRRE